MTEPTFDLHKENKFYRGNLLRIEEDDGKFGPQLKWFIELDEDDPYIDDDGTEQPRETWAWTSNKLTTHDKNTFRRFVKGLLGEEPQKGEMFDERKFTKKYYDDNPEEKEALNGKTPWRVAVMFTHGKKADGTPFDKVSMLISEDQLD